MLVWRVEDFDGTGPYMAYANHHVPIRNFMYSGAVNHNGTEHPNPYNDGLGEVQLDEFCGFDNLEMLQWWFRKCETALFESYMDVTMWEVEKEFIRFGKKQLLFRRGYARLITRTSYPTN